MNNEIIINQSFFNLKAIELINFAQKHQQIILPIQAFPLNHHHLLFTKPTLLHNFVLVCVAFLIKLQNSPVLPPILSIFTHSILTKRQICDFRENFETPTRERRRLCAVRFPVGKVVRKLGAARV